MYLLAVTAASRTIDLSAAYFVPDDLTLQAIVEAMRRGVRLRIVVPGKHIDSATVRSASRTTWGPLLAAGAIIAEYEPTMYHCKLLIIDGLLVSVGSTHFDHRSFRFNDEATLNVVDLSFAALARLVMVICLATGVALDAAIGPHRGKGSGELGLVRRLLEGFTAGDVMLADALYCNYFLIAALVAQGVDVLFEQNGSRITDFRRGQSLGQRDHLVRWPKPASRPEWMTPEQYAQAPEEITLREVKVGPQVLVTTLHDHRRVSKSDLSGLYASRWNVELDLRNLKTTTGMDVLSCQTPQMNEKQLWVHLLAYNVIRLLMAQAACNAELDPRSLSFKHTVQLWTEWMARGLCSVNDRQRLFTLIAQCKVGHRPGRIEPRMRKRRPKPYPWLKVPRAQARRDVQRNGHA